MCVCVFLAELEELLLSLKQVRGCLTDQQSQNDIELVLALLNKVTHREFQPISVAIRVNFLKKFVTSDPLHKT